jgi:hypothetical protein
MDKICTKCKLPQDLSEFSKHPKGKNGLQAVCKTCTRVFCHDYREDIKRQVFEFYGGKCQCCGESNMAFLTLDHVNNDGAEHRKQLGIGRGGKSTDVIYRQLVKGNFADADRFRVLCYNCNCGRHGGVCPHQVQ